ncbi:homocysteine S-methyltransferase family protein [Devosia sp. ZB163]|uniref:homocysteine S-methyltransferase family protein n=1 Tax=Devosia sp. ZB163 TaxID=3025938 RepID=UPI0023623519|nr:homocysteine S-methyltransferase family protein [Devosia sp. ZB163]MDC9822249.1 homocysteine S-methyltransferase family protein [Devosia sp. ZB163]
MFVTDGGVETHLIFNEGQDVPDQSVYLLNMSEAGRAKMREYYRAYIPICQKAGQGFLFDTNTWRANPDWGTRAGYDAVRLREANQIAVAFCEEMQAEFAAAGVESIISGVLGPRRDAWRYDAWMTVEEATAYHTPQIEAFADTDADYVSAYTLTNVPEAVGIARAAEKAGVPVVLSFTLETDGNLPGGKPLGVAISEVDAATHWYPAYYMINCVHPIHFASVVRHGGKWVDRIGGLRVNASMMSHAELDNAPSLDTGNIPDLAQRYARVLPSLPNIRVIGGCCGTDHRHIDAICATCLPG